MSEHTITAKGHESGADSITYPVIVRRVSGLSSSYEPGGYSVGIVPAGRDGRRDFQGPMIAGPWGYLYGRAAVIDTSGGTARDLAIAASEGRVIDELGHGDVLVIEGTRYVVSVNRYSGDVRLDPEPEPARMVYRPREALEIIASGNTEPDRMVEIAADALHDDMSGDERRDAERADTCSECGGSLADGEGYDGKCGTCADRADPAERPITAARFVALERMAEELYEAYVAFYGDPDDGEMSQGECDMLRRAETILGEPQTRCDHEHSEP